MRFIKTVVFVVVLLLIAAGVGIASGAYDIGADAPHWSVTERAIELLRDRSIAQHAQGVTVPDLDDPKRMAEGAEHYAAMCTGCHLAPGQSDSELRQGLYPMPPNLSQAGVDNAAEAFWVIKHGVKLTAMPAWGKSHDDESIWNLVAFVRQLPKMTPEQYQQATANAGGHEHHHHGGGDDAHVHDPDAHDHGEDAAHSHDAHGGAE
jgi:mono/diheme cytochrome c family protein